MSSLCLGRILTFSTLFTVAAFNFGCRTAATNDSALESKSRPAKGAKVGETCGDGTFGTPSIKCAGDLVCKFPPEGTAPTGPAGSSSAIPGTCQEPGAGVGETCGDGTFGTPDTKCSKGLVCKFPKTGTAPAGPDGSSSAIPGTCELPDAKAGETCGDGFFGRPKIDCGEGLICVYPKVSPSSRRPPGSSSALPGKCTSKPKES
jgi:hypothetical protein